MDQEKYHPVLRKGAQKWMRENKTELLEWGLLDGEKEIEETGELGVWPGQAAIVALANILKVNIAVIQGGDKGDIDIQHICPFETAADAEQGSIILAYLYNGHYDAIVEQPDLENPEFEAWTIRRKQEVEADEALARKLAAEEGYNDSASPPIPNDVQHVSNVHVSSSTRPLCPTVVMKEQPLVRQTVAQKTSEIQKNSTDVPQTDNRRIATMERPETLKHTTLIQVVDQRDHHKGHSTQYTPADRTTKVSPPARPQIKAVTGITRTVEPPLQPKPPRPALRTASEEERSFVDESRLKITLYPKAQSSSSQNWEPVTSKRDLYKPAPSTISKGNGQFHVNRKPADSNILHDRQLRDIYPTNLTRQSSPSIRVIPIQFVGRPSGSATQPTTASRQEFDRRTATRRKDVPAKGHDYENTWRQQTSFDSYQDRNHCKPESTMNRQYATHSLYDDPASHRNTIAYQPNYTSNNSHTHSRTTTPRSTLSRGSAVAREIPVMVLSARSPDMSTRSRATPAPATYALNESFEMPPQLRPYRSALSKKELESMLRTNFWL